MDPQNCIYYSNRAGAFINSGDFDQGFQDAEKCLELDSKFIKGYLRKGMALERKGSKDQAKAVYQQGLEVDPQNNELKQQLQKLENPQP